MNHICVIDLFNDHRPHLCRDAAGEALPYRDANPLTDRRFDPLATVTTSC
jgi:hypothetical protein